MECRERERITIMGSMFARMGLMDVVSDVMSERRAAKFNSNRGSYISPRTWTNIPFLPFSEYRDGNTQILAVESTNLA